MEKRFILPGSEADHPDGGSWLPADAGQKVTPTIIIRRAPRAGDLRQKLLSGSLPPMSREEAENLIRVDPNDLAAVRSFAQSNGLTAIAENAEARTMQVEGTVAQVAAAFGVTIEWRIDPEGKKYLSYLGAITLPESVAGIIEAVLGLDQRPLARRGAGQ